MGFRRGDKLAIIGDNRPRLYWAIAATQALGGVPVPIYQDSIAEEMAFVLDHAEVRFAMAEDQEQVDKLVEIKERCPLLETVIFSDPRGMRHYGQPWLDDYANVQERGREFARKEPGFFRGEIAKGRGSDTAIILYTSGTTGRPKGVVLSFDNIITDREERDRVRGPDRPRGGAGLSADGVDRRAHLLLRRRPIAPGFAPPARNPRRR